MDLFPILVATLFVLLLIIAARPALNRRPPDLECVLFEVEAASALVIADWPRAQISAHLDLLSRERLGRSASYKQGWHTEASRERDYQALQRIGRAEKHLRVARELASRKPAKTVDAR